MIKKETYNIDEIIIRMLIFVWRALFAVETYNIEAFLYDLCFESKDALEKTHCGGTGRVLRSTSFLLLKNMA